MKSSLFRFAFALAAAAATLTVATVTTGVAVGAPPGRHDSAPTVDWNRSSLSLTYAPAAGFYSYAPSVVRDGNAEWIWSCHNGEYRTVKDHIYLTKVEHGVVTKSRSVLQASPAPAWDSFHTCDPSVVSGNFRYGGTRYRYAMFYLGNDLDASAHNQVGVAFAKRPEGPWTKYPDPIVTSDRTDEWGVGQPTAISLSSRSGRVLLAYTRGDTSTRAYASVIDLSNVDRLRVGQPVLLPTAGLTGTDGSPDYLNGFDIALDRTGHRIFTVREQHPYPQDNPWWIGPSVQVDSLPLSDFLAGRGRWSSAGNIDQQLTGFTRNHNAGLIRAWDGQLPASSGFGVVFTSSCSSLPTIDDQDWSQATCDSLYSYKLWTITGTLTGRRPGR